MYYMGGNFAPHVSETPWIESSIYVVSFLYGAGCVQGEVVRRAIVQKTSIYALIVSLYYSMIYNCGYKGTDRQLRVLPIYMGYISG